MIKTFIFATTAIALCLLLGIPEARAQSTEVSKFEVGADFTSITFSSGQSKPGLGSRLTYNLNKHLALEAAGYFFPGRCDFCGGEVTGRIVEGLFGVKAGKRFNKWGVFAKARPGLIRFGKGAFDIVPSGTATVFPFTFINRSLTHAALDLGGVVEFYPSKHLVVRFDGGDTIIHHQRRTFNGLFPDPGNPTGAILLPVTSPAFTRHTFQFMGGVGFRF